MHFELIDYSYICFQQPLPDKRQGKFIQVISPDTEYIILSPKELSVFHANIAEKFFDTMGIKGKYNRKRDDFRVSTPSWEILGGGYWELDEGKGLMVLSGESMAYGRFLSTGLHNKLRSAKPELNVNIRH